MTNSETSHQGQPSITTPYNAEPRGHGGDPADFVALHGSIGFSFDPRIHFAWPAASSLGLVFPMYLASAIVKNNGKAWLKASFENNFAACELEFFVSASEIQHIAKELFDLHIATKGQGRGIRLDNDAFIKFDGSITVSGSRLEKLDKIVGIQAVEAYQLSPSRADELNNGQTGVTNCLSMEMWPEVNCPSRLRLRVEVGKLSSIAGQLWPGMLMLTGS